MYCGTLTAVQHLICCRKLGLSVKALKANTERIKFYFVLVETKNQPFTKSKRIYSPIPQVIVVRSLLLKRDNERSKI